jgi:general secretion pathway protein C
MADRKTPLLVHVLGAAALCGIAAYWALRLFASPTAAAPPPPPLAARDADPALAARLFGDLSAGQGAALGNVQVGGVFVAGRYSSAVLSIDGRPARAVLLGRDAAPGTRLVEVRADGVTLERSGARAQFGMPPPAVARASTAAPQYHREGDTLTAPSMEPFSPGRPAPGMRGLTLPGNAPALSGPVVRPGGEENPPPGRMPPPLPGPGVPSPLAQPPAAN